MAVAWLSVWGLFALSCVFFVGFISINFVVVNGCGGCVLEDKGISMRSSGDRK